MTEKEIILDKNARVAFSNQVDYCIGTGRMGLALHQEYQEQLRLVQDYIGFSHIRGHGLFCDDMAIYQEQEDGSAEYNFTYLDRVMDSYLKLGLKPFLELGFMPQKLARGSQTLFYWRANTTPPASYERWNDMVQALLQHLCERYGREEVVTWPIEVWNEPNLSGFWENADMEEYFRLFYNTFYAVKKIDPRFRVGGPAVCGGSDEVWIKAFMEYCHKQSIPLDFVTRHHYTTELPEKMGHYGYAELQDVESGLANLHTTREIIDSYPRYRGLEIHITEFNTSYIPNCPLHDTCQNAAFIARQLSRLGDDNASYSYWTFGDVFEEQGVPFTPFHGGFGLVANGSIPKPTFWTFVFYKRLKEKPGHCIYRDDNMVVMQLEDGSCRGVAWNMAEHAAEEGSTLCADQCIREELHLLLRLQSGEEGCLLTQTVDEAHGNPLKIWHDLGEPSSLTEQELELLRTTARPYVETRRIVPEDGRAALDFTVKKNGVVYFSWIPGRVRPDRGYSYERVMGGRVMQREINMSRKQAWNPYLPSWEYIPDAEPYVFGDRVYVYGSHDYYNGYVFCMGDYVCWSAPVDDLGNWRYEGIIYEKTADPFNRSGKMCLYAPDVTVGPDGRYYLYYVLDKVSVVSVAVCDSPAGKYEFYGYVHYMDGTRLGERAGDEPQFDPGVLTEQGRTYLYTGFCGKGDKSRHGAMVTVLDGDMLTVVESPRIIVPGCEYSTGTEFEGHAFFEAPSIRKKGSTYYFVYSSQVMHELCYAVSKSPTGDFRYGGVLVSNCDLHIDSYKPEALPTAYGANNHGSIVEIQGQPYIFYHRHTNGTWYSRQGCAEKLHVHEDGSIDQAQLTSCGLNDGPLPGRGYYPAYLACNLFTDVPSAYVGGADQPRVMQDGRDGDETLGYIGNIQDGATAGFKFFRGTEATQISIWTRGYAKGIFEVRTEIGGRVLAELPVEYANVWEESAADIVLPEREYAIYLTFRGQGNAMLKGFELRN